MRFGVPLLMVCLALGSSEATISLKPVSRLYLPSDTMPMGGGGQGGAGQGGAGQGGAGQGGAGQGGAGQGGGGQGGRGGGGGGGGGAGGRGPTAGGGGPGMYVLNSGAAFKTAYDMDKKLAYVGGRQFVQIIDFSDVVIPKAVKKIVTQGPVADIAECGDLVAFLQPGQHYTDVGSLRIYEKYNPATMEMKELCSVTVGSQPIAVRFAQGCSLIIVANEGKMGENNVTKTFVNPEGTITTVRLAGSVSNGPSQQIVNTTFGAGGPGTTFPPAPPTTWGGQWGQGGQGAGQGGQGAGQGGQGAGQGGQGAGQGGQGTGQWGQGGQGAGQGGQWGQGGQGAGQGGQGTGQGGQWGQGGQGAGQGGQGTGQGGQWGQGGQGTGQGGQWGQGGQGTGQGGQGAGQGGQGTGQWGQGGQGAGQGGQGTGQGGQWGQGGQGAGQGGQGGWGGQGGQGGQGGGGFGGNAPQYPMLPTTPLPGTICNGTPTMSYVVKQIDFTRFNAPAEVERLKALHVRQPYTGQLGDPGPNTFSQGLEPRHITLDAREQTAFISLQENNAIAVIDLANNSVIDILPMGVKNWANLKMDASSFDGGVMLDKYEVQSFPMPDAIETYYDANGDMYVVTANEGAHSKNVECSPAACPGGPGEFVQTEIGEEFVAEEFLSPTLMQSPLGEDMAVEERLGRSRFSLVDGNNPNDPEIFDQVYMFGGRGISAYKVDPVNMNATLAWDSGDIIEKEIAKFFPKIFNGAAISGNPRRFGPKASKDIRSGDRGPECESLAVGDVQGRKLIFVGIDGVSALAIFSVAPGNSTPQYESMYRDGYIGNTYQKLYAERMTGDLSPESLTFIPPEKSLNNKPHLLVTGRVSGTISMYEVVDVPYWMLLKTLGTNMEGSAISVTSSSISILFAFLSGMLAIFMRV